MKSKEQKRMEAIERLEATKNIPKIGKNGEPKNDTKRRKNVQAAIDNTKAKLKGGF